MIEIEFFRWILPTIIAVIIVILNFKFKKYDLISVNSDYIVISRLFMSEHPIYSDEIVKITLKELANEKVKVVIITENKTINYHHIDEGLYFELVDFAIKHKIDYYLEYRVGRTQKMKKEE